MKFASSLLLLLVASCCLYQGCWARVEAIPLDLMESLKLEEENIDLPLPVEDEIYERLMPEGRASGKFLKSSVARMFY